MSAPANPPEPLGKAASIALVAVLCLIWSSTWFAIRICLEEQPPLSSAGVRFLIAGVTMTLLAPMLRRRENVPAPPAWLWITCGLTNFAGGYGVLYCAETVVPSGIAAVLWGIFPILMAGSAVTFLDEKLSVRQWLGFAVSFGGIVLVFSSDLGGISEQDFGYAWLVLLSPLIATVGTTLVKKHGSHTSSVVLNQRGMLLGAALLLATASVREDPLAMTWSLRVTIATVLLAVIGTTLAFGVYFWLLRTAKASLLSLINYVTPVLAMLLAEAVGDGAHDAASWLGAALVVFGIALVVRR